MLGAGSGREPAASCSGQEAATTKFYIQVLAELLLLLLLRWQNESGVCKESCMSPSFVAKADTERMIWGLAPGPNMSAGVEKRARKSGCLQSHVVLEATASFSRGEKHTFLGCQGLYSACLGLAGSACVSSEFGWCHGSGQEKGLGFFPGWKLKEFLKLWRWQLSPSGWPQRPVVPQWTCSILPPFKISPHIPPFATSTLALPATGTARPGSPQDWGWCEAAAPLPLPW